MSETPAAELNAAQVAYWNADMGRRWAELQDEIDAMFVPLTAAALARAAPQPGEHVLDIGCGCGATLVELAARVGGGGSVLGVDISAPMLARASERIDRLNQADPEQVRVVLADAASYPFTPSMDLVFSRFGVMFFDDPVAAFANIRRALGPGGRLLMAVWRRLADNEWARVPLAAALKLLPPQPPPEPEAPGPFALADPDRVSRILTQAGFADVSLSPFDPPIRLGGPGSAARAAARSLQIGPAARAVADAEPAVRDAIEAAILAEFTKIQQPDGLTLGGGIWLVSARR